MAVIRTLQWFRGRRYCLLIDPDADSVEVVFEGGFNVDHRGEFDFYPAYFVDAGTEGLPFPEITIRLDEATDAPLGLMLERVARRHRRLLRPWASSLRILQEELGFLLGLGDALAAEMSAAQEHLWTAPREATALERSNGGWILRGPLEYA